MTVAQLLDTMSSEELTEWIMYLKMKADEQEGRFETVAANYLSMPTGIKLLGAKELIEQFRSLNHVVQTQYVDESLQAGAETIRDAVKSKVPVGKGTLQNALSLRTTLVTATRVEKQLVIDKAAWYWKFLEFGTKYIKPMHFIRQAFRNRKGTARQVIRDTFRDRVLGFED